MIVFSAATPVVSAASTSTELVVVTDELLRTSALTVLLISLTTNAPPRVTPLSDQLPPAMPPPAPILPEVYACTFAVSNPDTEELSMMASVVLLTPE